MSEGWPRGEGVTLDLRTVSPSAVLGADITLNILKKKKKVNEGFFLQ